VTVLKHTLTEGEEAHLEQLKWLTDFIFYAI
jgi:hypothetical protein